MSVGCTTTHIGGMYVAHGTDFVASLSLTQGENNNITGVLNLVRLDSDGKISGGEVPITSGTRDGQQLILTLNPGLLGIHFASLGRNLAAIIDGDTLRLQIPSPSGNIVPVELHRSSPTEFNRYADQLRAKAHNAKR